MKNKQSFFTPVVIPTSKIRVNHQQSILLMGSCFSEHIGEQLKNHKFNVDTNPFGIIYNPISLVKGLKNVFDEKLYDEGGLNSFNNKWFSFDHHGSFSAFNKEQVLSNINKRIKETKDVLKNTKTIIITLGSAWVYEYENFGIVANCHKIPNKQFTKKLLTVKEIIAAFEILKKELSTYNVIFTVSPVRHTRDGLHENNLSKATLLLAINNLVNQHTNYNYFPAYELVIDELRDYRFFKDDLVHPTTMAINYVWDKFKATYCDLETTDLILEIEKIKVAVNHKPFNYESEAHQQFVKKQVKLMKELTKQHSFLNFEEEKRQLENGGF